MTRTRVPVVEGWFTIDEPPTLIGAQCPDCGTKVFPPRSGPCPNPACEGADLGPTTLARRGTIWSYTENRYAPPPPYVTAEPFAPYALAAVSLEGDGLTVLGQVAAGVLAADLAVGMTVELDLMVLSSDDEHDYLVYAWAPANPGEHGHG
jgi:uncharacterized OB-fold protein